MKTKEMAKMKEERLLNEDSYNSISKKTGIHWNMVKRAEIEPENVPARKDTVNISYPQAGEQLSLF